MMFFIINRLTRVIKSKTAKDSLIMLFGAAITTVLGFFVTVILARGLSPIELGLILTALTFTQLVSDMFELGINSAVLNFVSSSSEVERPVFLKFTFMAKLTIALLVGLGVLLLASPLSMFIFKSEEILPFVQISSIGVALLMLVGWEQSVFQAKKMFIHSSLLGVLINILRVLGILVILAVGIFNPINSYIVLQVVLVIGIVVFLFKIGKNFFRVKNTTGVFNKVFGFGLPVGFGFALAAIYTKLDQIIIFNLLGGAEAGIYGLAFRVMSVFLFAGGALNAAITPRFASLHPDQFSAYFKKTLLAAFGLGFLSALGILVAPIFLPIIFGAKFYSSILPFQILSIGAIFFILSSPFYTAILYKFKKTKYSLFISLASLLLIWGLLNLLIPVYKSLGAAIAVTLIYGFQFIISVAFFFFWSRKT